MKNLLLLVLACLMLVQVTYANQCEDDGGICRKKKNCGCLDGAWDNGLSCDSNMQTCCMPNAGVNPDTWEPCIYCEDAGGRCRDPDKCACDGGDWSSDFYCGQWAETHKCCMADAGTDVDNWYACDWEYPTCEKSGGRCHNPDKCPCIDGTYDSDKKIKCGKDGEICCLANEGVDVGNWISCDWQRRTCEDNGGVCRDSTKCDCNDGDFDSNFGCGVNNPQWKCCMPDTPNDPSWIPCTWQNNLWCEENGGRCRNPSKCDCDDGSFYDGDDYQCSVAGAKCCFANDGIDVNNWVSCDWELRTCEDNGGVCRDPTKCDCNDGDFDSDFGCGVDNPQWECCMPDDPNDASWISCIWRNNLWCEAEGGRCRAKSNCDCYDGSFDGYEPLQCSGDGEECCFPNHGVDVENWISCDWELRTCEKDGGVCRKRGPKCQCNDGHWDPVATACGAEAPEKQCCLPNGGVDPWYACDWEIPSPDQACLDVKGLCRDTTKCQCVGGSYDYSKQCGTAGFACCKPNGDAFPAGHIACPH